MGILIEQIGTNAYAPEGSDAINLYAFNGVYDLTLGQLTMAVCLRQASLIEQQSVLVMNKINESASWLEVLSLAGEAIMNKRSLDATFDISKTSYKPKRLTKTTFSYWEFLTTEAQIDAVPQTVSTVDEKTKLYGAVKEKMNAAMTNNQRQLIELQSVLSRRDSTYNSSASIVKKLGTTQTAVAGNF